MVNLVLKDRDTESENLSLLIRISVSVQIARKQTVQKMFHL